MNFSTFTYALSSLFLNEIHDGGPQGFGGAGEKGYLLSGNWGALAIILWSLRASTYFWRFREHCQNAEEINFRDSGRSEHYLRDQGNTDPPPPPVGPHNCRTRNGTKNDITKRTKQKSFKQ